MLEVLYTKRSVCQTICVIYSRPVGQTTEGVIHEEAVMSATHTQTRPLTFDERKEKKEIKKKRQWRRAEEDACLLGELGHLFLVDFLPFYELRGKILGYQVLH